MSSIGGFSVIQQDFGVMEELGGSISPTPVASTHSNLIETFVQQVPQPDVKQSLTLMNTLRAIPIVNRFVPDPAEKEVLIEKLLIEQKKATSFDNWYEISLKLDGLLDNDLWKATAKSDLYDYELLFQYLNDMKSAREAKDYKLLLYLIRTRWVRNIGNMGDINLFRHSFVGTKQLIEEYINECKLSLDYLVKSDEVDFDDRYLLGMLIQTRKNIGRTALLLSGGSTFGVFHVGVLVTLLEANLLPRIISGSSAGSIMAGIICSRTNDETLELLSGLTELRFDIFSDKFKKKDEQSNFKNLLNILSHFLKYGTLYDMSGLKETMIRFVGDLTFKEAYNRTGKILNVTVSPASIHEQTRLLNYLTAPNCLIWSVVCASCSLPGVFPSTTIFEKNPKTGEIQEWNNDTSLKYVDGSVENDLPISRLLEMFNVDHIIAVQVNPHVAPILKFSVSNIGGEVENELSNRFKSMLNNVYDFVSCETVHYLQILNEVDIYKNLSNKMISILQQNYSGDITILPDYHIADFVKIFNNPTPSFILDFIVRGAKASWPKITVINNHCGVEFALDKAISTLRGKLIISANYRITSKESTIPATLSYQNLNSAENFLINTPQRNESERTETPPGVIRRNTTSGSGRRAKKNKAKRLSLGSDSLAKVKISPKNDMKKGKSSTTLSAFNDYADNENQNQLRRTSNSGTDIKRASPLKSSFREENSIRKAKSSTNFRSGFSSKADWSPIGGSPKLEIKKPRYPARRVPSYANNPYTDENMLDNDEPAKVLFNMSKESATLPSKSTNNSFNSYIGLNRLKENIIKSKNGSSYNLQGYGQMDTNDLFNQLDSASFNRNSVNFGNNIFFTENDEDNGKILQEKEYKVEGYYGNTDDETDNQQSEFTREQGIINDMGGYYGITDEKLDKGDDDQDKVSDREENEDNEEKEETEETEENGTDNGKQD